MTRRMLLALPLAASARGAVAKRPTLETVSFHGVTFAELDARAAEKIRYAKRHKPEIAAISR